MVVIPRAIKRLQTYKVSQTEYFSFNISFVQENLDFHAHYYNQILKPEFLAFGLKSDSGKQVKACCFSFRA